MAHRSLFPKLVSLVTFAVILMRIATFHGVNCGTTFRKNFSNAALDFLQANGKKNLNFVTMDNEDLIVKEALRKLVRASKLTTKIRSRVLLPEDIKTKHRFHEDTLILVTSSQSKNWDEYVDIVAGTKIMSSLIICLGEYQRQIFDELCWSLQNKSKSSFFYWMGVEGQRLETIDWKEIISLKNTNKIIGVPIKFDSFGRVVFEKNLHGVHINCSTVSWAPYFELTGCKGENETNCKGVGYLADIMNILGNRFNFTWSCDKEPNRFWGNNEPISGPRNISGSWGGIMGNVINGSYHLCVGIWNHFEWRHSLLDFASMGTGSSYRIAYLPQSSYLDLWLFIRPFTSTSWIVLVTLVSFIISVKFLGRHLERYIHQRNGTHIKFKGIKLIHVIGWLFFILIMNGFYDGALTMFFAQEIEVNFNSESDLLKDPDWKYNLKISEIHIILSRAESGDELYQKTYDLVKANPDEFYFETIAEGIERMKSGQIAIQLQETALRQFYKQNPSEPRPNSEISTSNDNTENFILTKNSPLTPIFAAGSMELYETGVMKILKEKWMGKKLESKVSDPLHTVVLDLGQMVMVFLLLGAAIILSIIILAIELFSNGVFKYLQMLESQEDSEQIS